MPLTKNRELQRTLRIINHNEKINHLENGMTSYWKYRAPSYSDLNKAQLLGSKKQAWEAVIFSQVEETHPLRILDIGTGPGFFAILSALRGHQVTAVDMSADMLEKARYNAAMSGAEITFQQVGHMLPFDDESFDLILSRDVTWTLTEPEKQMRHWAEKLKPGGTMLYFDAEWYYYLKEENKRKKAYLEPCQSIKSKTKELEYLAANLPMTYQNRPTWDIEFWEKQEGFECLVYENLNPIVYDEQDQQKYRTFLEFLVAVRRG
ncbi:MAG: class I SAM-dependent methyltransferase [Oscillospiraceae bacterium]|jgi:SAM-dependent methyltransferase